MATIAKVVVEISLDREFGNMVFRRIFAAFLDKYEFSLPELLGQAPAEDRQS